MATPPPTAPDAAPGSLGDPLTCGEDHDANIRRALAYAPAHCGACIDYHMLFPIRRGIGRVAPVARDRADVIALVGGLVAARAAGSGPIDIVVAGTADTQIPAACAHAAFVHGGAAFGRVRLAVLDACDTPLQLCRDFAARHAIALTTHVVDLVASGPAFSADILVHHSLIGFLPAEHHVATLGKLAGWLKPGGRMVFSLSLKPPHMPGQERHPEANGLIRAALEAGTLEIAEPRAVFEERMKNRGFRLVEFADAGEVRALLARSGLAVVGDEISMGRGALAGTNAFERDRVLAVLGVPD